MVKKEPFEVLQRFIVFTVVASAVRPLEVEFEEFGGCLYGKHSFDSVTLKSNAKSKKERMPCHVRVTRESRMTRQVEILVGAMAVNLVFRRLIE